MTNKQNKKYDYREQNNLDRDYDYEAYIQQQKQQSNRRRNKRSHKRDDYYADEEYEN